MESVAIVEASGIAASRRHPGVLWVHNDSGDTPRLYALAEDGRHLGAFALAGATAVDWEDIAVGPGPVAGRSYLYVGDIGDNARTRAYVTVYRVPEPEVDPQTEPVTGTLADVEHLELVYPGGPSDAECLCVDPRTADLYIVTKRGDGLSEVYRDSQPHADGRRATLTRVATLAFGTPTLPGSPLVTAGDISPAGDEILLRTYTRAFLWRRGVDEEVGTALQGEACPVPLRLERQGEAIGFAADGDGYMTVSEGEHPSLYFFQRDAAAAP